MRVAFYAPLKSPDHPVPSGDRLLARLFIAALRSAGHEVEVASRVRMFEGRGDAARQSRLAAVGAGLAQRLVRRWQRSPARAPELWFTYHLYHKAPDRLGPIVAQVLRIPYVIAEASFAPKQRDGPWSDGHAAVEAAIRAADAIVCINPADAPMVDALRDSCTPLVALPPFIDVERFVAGGRDAVAHANTLAPPGAGPRLVTVAMMRPGDKLASYRILAAALSALVERPWHLVVVGDGAAQAQVREAFAALPAQRVRLVGRQPPDVVAALLGTADLFVWPAVAEVLGLAMLEAQACGVPVVAGRRPGSAAMIVDGVTGVLVPPGDVGAFAGAVGALLDDPDHRRSLGAAAARNAQERHAVASAAAQLDELFARIVAGRRTGLT